MTNYPENTQSLTSGTHFSIIFLLLTTRLPGAQRCVPEKLDNTNPSLPAYSLCQKTKCNETTKSEEENWHSFLISCCLMSHLEPSSWKMRSTTGNNWAGFEVLYFNRTNLTFKLNQLVTSWVKLQSLLCTRDRRQAPRPGGDTVAMTHRALETLGTELNCPGENCRELCLGWE